MVLKDFLEASTIHGLSYIAGTQRFARVFWTFIVFTGFIAAFLLINQAFQSWSESPISTNIDMLPITDFKFPKVTVCPPKNTFTNLNYDLVKAENMSLSNETRKGLVEYAFTLLHEPLFEKILENLEFVHEVPIFLMHKF